MAINSEESKIVSHVDFSKISLILDENFFPKPISGTTYYLDYYNKVVAIKENNIINLYCSCNPGYYSTEGILTLAIISETNNKEELKETSLLVAGVNGEYKRVSLSDDIISIIEDENLCHNLDWKIYWANPHGLKDQLKDENAITLLEQLNKLKEEVTKAETKFELGSLNYAIEHINSIYTSFLGMNFYIPKDKIHRKGFLNDKKDQIYRQKCKKLNKSTFIKNRGGY
ncbi:MAG: hypothetical protein PHQ89_00915 [Bacilli bacterium]|nr:hypothetical protein [Bacilli bacterium]